MNENGTESNPAVIAQLSRSVKALEEVSKRFVELQVHVRMLSEQVEAQGKAITLQSEVISKLSSFIERSKISMLSVYEYNLVLEWLPKGRRPTKLLYKATRDNWSLRALHAQCDYRGPLLFLLRGNFVFGGFLSQPLLPPDPQEYRHNDVFITGAHGSFFSK
jgi:hypothetical protein